MKAQDYVKTIALKSKSYHFYDIRALQKKGVADISRLPFTIRILVENLLRKLDGRVVTEEDLIRIARWQKTYREPVEIPFHPARVIMHDYTGVPAIVDMAAMRDAVKGLGGDPNIVNPLIPVEFIVDHSVQIDYFGSADALDRNVEKEYARNGERYTLLKWAQKNFDNFKVVPPKAGICHQVNLEYLSRVVISETIKRKRFAYPDTMLCTDSHTPMINGIGVVGVGVGGIEAEAVMLGQPYYIAIPEVIGVRLTGRLSEGVTATDLVLTITERLRKHNVVEKYVEYFGPGIKNLTVPDRATVANMTPEYGATLGFFPVDEKTIEYLKLTNRQDRADLAVRYLKAQGLFYHDAIEPEYTQVLEFDLGSVEPCVAGPSRPQDRIELKNLKTGFARILGCDYQRDVKPEQLSVFIDESGTRTMRSKTCQPVNSRLYDVVVNGHEEKIGDGSVVIAAITSCTNTSNPHVLLGAGLVAKKAIEKGLRVAPCVKTSLAPGSKVVIRYLTDAGLMPYLEALGFHAAGFGCTTCIGNSGPLNPEIEKVIRDNDLTVAAVLSGNRNFEARIHQSVKANFLASPMLVVVFALAGRIDVDLTREPIGLDPNGRPVYIEELWPRTAEIKKLIQQHVRKEFFKEEYGRIFDGDPLWHKLPVKKSTTYNWDPASTYIKKPPFFEGVGLDTKPTADIGKARTLLLLGDSITTDHISPAGAFSEKQPAGQYLMEKGVAPAEFNSYGTRRGNHEVMMRGAFANIRIKNKLVEPKEGGLTLKFPEKKEMPVYEAAMSYRKEGIPLVVLGGREYGGGSSRDWAAKGPNLLGVKAVIAESFERIHRSNLIGMGILPLQFKPGQGWQKLGLKGSESYFISGIDAITPRKTVSVQAVQADGDEIRFEVIARLDTEVDIAYFQNGGILPYVLRKLMREKKRR